MASLNLIQAKSLRPENYGQKSLLYKISKEFSNSWKDELDLEADITEGPINLKTAPTSYLEGTALTEDKAGKEKAPEGINTLLSTTQNESAIISPEITDPSLIAKRRDKIIDYVIQPGDTVSTIASRFGITTNTILWENNLSVYSTIRPGQTLKILPTSGISHKVKKGNTLKSIAKLYKGSMEEIIEFNKLASETDLEIGDVVVIPGGVKQVAAAPSYSVKTIFTPPAKISASKLEWPTTSYRITQYFKWRHSAIDIGSNTGEPVYAAEGGMIETAGWNKGGYGYYIAINHSNGLKTLYAHLSRIYIKPSQQITRGQVIGAVGNTGRSTGPHLHFEVRLNGVRVNPLGYVR